MLQAYMLDTSTLVYDPKAIYQFGKNDILIPFPVIEELSALKKEPGEKGKKARDALAEIEKVSCLEGFCGVCGASLGEELGNLSIEAPSLITQPAPEYVRPTADNVIVRLARHVLKSGREIALVTRDRDINIKARAHGIKTMGYENPECERFDIGKVKRVQGPPEVFEAFYARKRDRVPTDMEGFWENDAILLEDPEKGSCIPVIYREKSFIRVLNSRDESRLFGISPRNAEQRFLAHFLMDREIDLIVCAGVAGSGKTLLSLAAGLQQTLSDGAFDRILLSKAIQDVGPGIGFVKGDKREKMEEWIRPFYDNFELIMQRRPFKLEKLFDDGTIDVEALTYMQGRSLIGSFCVMDEVQNIDPKHMKMIVTRPGDRSKLVLLGDIDRMQINNEALGVSYNGLRYTMERMRGLPNVAILSLTKSERKLLTAQAVERL